MFQLERQIEELKNEDTKVRAKLHLETFCEEIKRSCCEAIDAYKTQAENQIDSIVTSASSLSPELENIQNEFAELKEDPEAFIPMDKFSKVHGQVASMDIKLSSLRKAFDGFVNGDSEKEIDEIHLLLEELLKRRENACSKYCSLQSAEIEAIKENFIFTALESMGEAVVSDDLESIKEIIENPKMPRKAIKYFLNSNLLFRLKDRPVSMLTKACRDGQVGIAHYFVNLDGVNLMERYGGKTVVQHMLSVGKVSPQLEKLIEELLEREPNLICVKDSQSRTVFQMSIMAGSVILCRSLIEDYGVELDDPFDNGTTPLILAIRLKQAGMLQELLFQGASLLVRDLDGNCCLHEACKGNWVEAIRTLLCNNFDLVYLKNDKGETPVSIIIEKDLLDTLLVMEECIRNSHLRKSLDKHYIREIANQMKAQKIFAWSKTYKFKK